MGFSADHFVLSGSASNEIKNFVVKQNDYGVYLFIINHMKLPC